MSKDEAATLAVARRIDWASAEVEARTLSVELDDTPPRGFATRFKAVVALLGDSKHGWGSIAIRKRRIEVHDVQDGSESELRHLLESALLQVNSDLELEEEPTVGKPSQEDVLQQADRQLERAFRAFAEQSSAS